MIGDSYGWVEGGDERKPSFLQPFVMKQRMGFRYALLPVQATRLGEGEEAGFYLSLVKYGRELGWDFIGQSPSTALFAATPDGAVAARFGSYVIDLAKTEEELWAGVHSKHRNVIRNAQRRRVVVKAGKEYAAAAFDLIKRTMGRSQMGFVEEKRYFRFLDEASDNVEVFCSFDDGQIQGCAIIPFSQFSGYYLWGGSVGRTSPGSINLMHWVVMQTLKEKGCRSYDFVGARLRPRRGSKIEGIQRFKERFGGEFRKGYLWKYPIRRGRCALYESLARIRGIGTDRFRGDIIDQERRSQQESLDLSDV
jgi:hypothetical protein